jgi:hypothetical protein
MHQPYKDITSKLGDPIWWDENAVPRYCEFEPRQAADIYAREVALVLIQCQDCRHRFRVAISFSYLNWNWNDGKPGPSLAESIKSNAISYGDPPNIGCCPAGPTMSSDEISVLEFWHFNTKTFEWERDSSLEITLPSI